MSARIIPGSLSNGTVIWWRACLQAGCGFLEGSVHWGSTLQTSWRGIPSYLNALCGRKGVKYVMAGGYWTREGQSGYRLLVGSCKMLQICWPNPPLGRYRTLCFACKSITNIIGIYPSLLFLLFLSSFLRRKESTQGRMDAIATICFPIFMLVYIAQKYNTNTVVIIPLILSNQG